MRLQPLQLVGIGRETGNPERRGQILALPDLCGDIVDEGAGGGFLFLGHPFQRTPEGLLQLDAAPLAAADDSTELEVQIGKGLGRFAHLAGMGRSLSVHAGPRCGRD